MHFLWKYAKKNVFCISIPKAFVLFILEIFHHFLAARSKILNFFLLRSNTEQNKVCDVSN